MRAAGYTWYHIDVACVVKLSALADDGGIWRAERTNFQGFSTDHKKPAHGSDRVGSQRLKRLVGQVGADREVFEPLTGRIWSGLVGAGAGVAGGV